MRRGMGMGRSRGVGEGRRERDFLLLFHFFLGKECCAVEVGCAHVRVCAVGVILHVKLEHGW